MSSIRTLKRSGMMMDGSSVNVIPVRSGVSSSVEMNGRSCTSMPIPWPILWRKCSPSPASSIGLRHAALTSRATVPAAAGGRAAPRAPRILRREHPPVDLDVVGRRLAAIDRSTEVGAVAVHDAAKVEHDRGSLREGAARRGGAGIEVIVTEAGEDMRCKGRAARAGNSQLVLDRLDEGGHRHPGHDKRRDSSHCALSRRDRTLHGLELLGALDTPELVDERRSWTQSVVPEDEPKIKDRLGPNAVTDRDACRRAQLARDPFEHSTPVVCLADNDDLAVRVFPEVEGGEHARQQEDRIPPRME